MQCQIWINSTDFTTPNSRSKVFLSFKIRQILKNIRFALDSWDIDLWDLDLLDIDLDLLDTDIPGKHFVCLQDVLKTPSV